MADLLKAWRGGYDLAEAWFHLAPPGRWETFDYPEATRRPSGERLEWSADDWVDADADERAYLQQAISAQFKIRSPSASREAQAEMKAWLVSELRNGRLIGLGQLDEPGNTPGIEVVPAFLFDPGNLDWCTSAAITADRRFTKIRVVDASTLPLSMIGSMHGEKRGRGRPTNRGNIYSAIDQLTANGIPLATMERPLAVDCVLDHLKSEMKLTIGPGYSPDVIQKSLLSKLGPRITNFN